MRKEEEAKKVYFNNNENAPIGYIYQYLPEFHVQVCEVL